MRRSADEIGATSISFRPKVFSDPANLLGGSSLADRRPLLAGFRQALTEAGYCRRPERRELDVLLLVFGAILVATILHAIGDPIAAWTSLSRAATLPLAGLIVIAVVGGAVWLFQAQVGGEVSAAVTAAQSALPSVGERLGLTGLSDSVTQVVGRILSSGGIIGKVTTVGTMAVQILTNILIILFGGIYLAVDPELYRDGFVKLLPAEMRDEVRETLNTAGRALKRWLLGQFVSMIITGALTWLALWVIGLPSAAGLAVIAGLAEFIPMLGPFLGAVPALLVAFTQGLPAVLWTAVAFIIVQQVESNLIQPLIARESVSLPPAVLLFAIIIFGVLFGVLGLMFAAPLTVVTFVAVKRLYVRDTLGDQTSIPGEKRG
jgi:predicted PurR-regulated permease PerM